MAEYFLGWVLGVFGIAFLAEFVSATFLNVRYVLADITENYVNEK
jgi:hypothetical protein